jgi:hypothetical protein
MYSVHITDITEEEILTTVKYIADVLKAPMAANNLLEGAGVIPKSPLARGSFRANLFTATEMVGYETAQYR